MADDGRESSSTAAATITPEYLEGIIAKGPDYHPMLPPDTKRDGAGIAIYTASMQIPAPNDEGGILRFLGLDDATITRIIGQLPTTLDQRPPPVGVVGGFGSSDFSFSFPLADKLRDLYHAREHLEQTPISPHTHETYINGGLAQGLRPEFAVFCGIHEIDLRFRGSGQGERFFLPIYSKSFREQADAIVNKNALLLTSLWRQKLAAEQGGGGTGRSGEGSSSSIGVGSST